MPDARPGAPAAGVRPLTSLWGALALLLGVLLAALPAQGDGPTAAPPAPPAVPAKAADPATSLRIGVFAVAVVAVVDGDTVKVPVEGSVRVLALDCEEVFHTEKDRAAAAADFPAYARARRGGARLPVKFSTPAGEAAKEFAKGLLKGVTEVRLERDEPAGHEHDGFGRRLAHVLLVGEGGERNLALEVVRAGHSPYFTKYGRSLRFDAAFRAAQDEARAARRGVWSETGPAHYGDYDERLQWWEERAKQVDAWRAAPATEERIELGTLGAGERLAARVGKQAVVFGSLAREGDAGPPWILWLSERRGADVPAVVFDEAVWKALDRAALARRFVTVRGPVTRYRDRPQIEITNVEQVSTR